MPHRIKFAVSTLLFHEVMNAIKFTGVLGDRDLGVAARSLSEYWFEIWRLVHLRGLKSKTDTKNLVNRRVDI